MAAVSKQKICASIIQLSNQDKKWLTNIAKIKFIRSITVNIHVPSLFKAQPVQPKTKKAQLQTQHFILNVKEHFAIVEMLLPQPMSLSVGGSWIQQVLLMPHPSSIRACVFVCECLRWGQSDRQVGASERASERDSRTSDMAKPWTGATSHIDQHVLEHCCIMRVPNRVAVLLRD